MATRRLRFKPSLAQTRRDNQAAMDFYRALSPMDDAVRHDVGAKPKQIRKPSHPVRVLERDVLNAVRQMLRIHPAVGWIARINSGGATDAAGQFMRFHTITGCSDLLGQMKASYGGALLAVECKRPGEKPTSEQAAFLSLVRECGGCAFWCDSIEACRVELGAWLDSYASRI